MNLHNFDIAIQQIQAPIGNEDVDKMLELIAQIVKSLRDEYRNVALELLTMYESASEHNVDVSREAIYQLAKRMMGI